MIENSEETSIVDLFLGLFGAAIAAILLVFDGRLFAIHNTDGDILGAVFLLAAAGQAAPMLGLAIAARSTLLRATRSQGPRTDQKKGGKLPASENVAVIALAAFVLAFIGVFALLYSIAFVPLVALAVLARLLYGPLVRNQRGARSVLRVLSLSAVGFGMLCLVLYVALFM